MRASEPAGEILSATEADKQSLLDCRQVVFSLLHAIQNRQQALRYLAPELARNYQTSMALADSILGSETSLVAAGVTNYEFDKNRENVRLHIFAVTSSEGTIVASEIEVRLTKIEDHWRISGLEAEHK